MISFADVSIVICLFLFLTINLDNLLRYHAGFSGEQERIEIAKPLAIPLLLAGIGTGAFFLESCLRVLLDFWNDLGPFHGYLGFGTVQLEFFGLLTMILGYAIFIWSVLARGRYATSWQMPADHKLVNWGPYRWVRHPSYLGYYLMFIGFALLWHNALALFPLIAIPGYVLIAGREEEMLVARFGEAYVQYQKRVGRFLPRVTLKF
ncbi:MAG: isoprenylcysteine carboxylmethyltransferase family protein [Candidatus Bathyarchaeia archaeon]|jgi:protein-S-isoprenylcysteine O-methyltransferase Ste14